MEDFIYETQKYDFAIPSGLIAQEPAEPRDSSSLLILNREEKSIKKRVFRDIIDFFTPGDCLVLNNTEVIKARLFGKVYGGVSIEVLLVKRLETGFGNK